MTNGNYFETCKCPKCGAEYEDYFDLDFEEAYDGDYYYRTYSIHCDECGTDFSYREYWKFDSATVLDEE